jgi:hypothetical protein
MQHAILDSSHSFHVMKTYNIPIILVFIVSTLGEVILKIFYETCEIGVYFGMLWIYKILKLYFKSKLKIFYVYFKYIFRIKFKHLITFLLLKN